MKFYCAWFCPFAQRVWMALLHKEMDFNYIEVDPFRESEWWLRISRQTAQVPVIVQPNDNNSGVTTIIESARILEYLEDLQPNKQPLFGSTPNIRAEQKYQIDQLSNKVIPYFYRFLKAAQDDDFRHESREKLLLGLASFSQAMSPTGAFFSGEKIGCVDIAFMPFAYRLDVLLSEYRDFTLPTTGENWQRYHAWYQALLKEPIFKATSLDHADYRQRLLDFYLPYSQGEGQKNVENVN